MSDEYYRGSSSYEVAVKNRLNALEATGVATTHAIQNMEAEVASSIRQSTYAIVASQENLRRTFAQGFNALNNTLQFGFTMMSSKLDEMADRICSKLDEIHDIVNNPLLTASRELYRRALTNYNKGYYEEALEDCKAAVEKNKTDFISWNLLGQIYLFGAGKFSNVIDLNLAEESFFTAAKYIDADIGHSSEANALASEIYYYLGYTRLVKSNDYLVENKAADSNTKLIEAANASGKAYKISNDNLLAGYEQAKELHFLGNDGEAMRLLEEIIRADKNYALKASNDKNFESIWEKIDALIVRLRDELAGKIKDKLAKLETTYNINILLSIDEKSYEEKKSELKKRYPNINEIETKDYFFVLDMMDTVTKFAEFVNEMFASLEEENKQIASFVTYLTFIFNKIQSSKAPHEYSLMLKMHKIKQGNYFSQEKNSFLTITPFKWDFSIFIGSEDDMCCKSSEWSASCYDFSYQKIPECIHKIISEGTSVTNERHSGHFFLLKSVIDKIENRADICNPNSKKDELHKAIENFYAFINSLPKGVVHANSACYVATAIYGSYDCPQVWTLRRFRDYKLAKTWYGRAFIHTYYAISPTIVKWFGETNWFKSFWRGKLDRMVKKLQARGFEDTPYDDLMWR